MSSNHYSSATHNQKLEVGKFGEQLVAQWLQAQDWVILHHRWRCRWGEIDLIAQQGAGEIKQLNTPEFSEEVPNPCLKRGNKQIFVNSSPPRPPSVFSSPLLAFVEVKTRSWRNWDANGLLAITPSKQAKLWRAAELFLSQNPEMGDFSCRFDVALVSYQRLSGSSKSSVIGNALQAPSIQLGIPILVADYKLILRDYIPSAFD